MSDEPRERLADMLRTAGGRARFSARRAAPPDDLDIEVTGVGPLRIPVPAAQARQLRAVARPARYGRGEDTLTDVQVRDTWEIPKSRVRIDRRRWNRTLLPVLERLRADLGLPDGSRLKADLHAVLLYETGQFFVPHQDSEKSDAMVGTLRVTLPSTARGGVLVVEHGGESATYRGSDTLVSFVAFYADCRHEVRPVTSGHRVVLTYNLSLVGDPVVASASPELVARLATTLDQHFAQQSRLVYLLDHQYTPAGLNWSRLKGVDDARVGALRAAADVVDSEIVLAVAEVQEIRDSWSSGGRYWEEDPDDDPDDDAFGDLIHRAITLDAWLDPSGSAAQPVVSMVGDAEVCASTPSASLEPYDSHHEGYMGNYGNTMDRWYRRGAVVLWPRRLGFAVRAQANPAWALDTLTASLARGEVSEARVRVGSLAPFWTDTLRTVERDLEDGVALTELFRTSLTIAVDLDDAATATSLLGPFHLELLSPPDAVALARLAGRYGHSWARDLLQRWDSGWRRPWVVGPDRPGWMATVPALCAGLVDHGAAEVAASVLERCGMWLTVAVRQARVETQPSQRATALGQLSAPIAGLLLGADTAGVAELQQATIVALCNDGDDLVHCSVDALRVMAAHGGGVSMPAALADQCRERLESRLARPERSSDDWSIAFENTCSCQLCATLGTFLADSTRQVLEWPIAEQSRRHVHDLLDRHELPVRHETRRQGRPYTLVLTKASALFERERRSRRDDEADLRWLVRTAGP